MLLVASQFEKGTPVGGVPLEVVRTKAAAEKLFEKRNGGDLTFTLDVDAKWKVGGDIREHVPAVAKVIAEHVPGHRTYFLTRNTSSCLLKRDVLGSCPEGTKSGLHVSCPDFVVSEAELKRLIVYKLGPAIRRCLRDCGAVEWEVDNSWTNWMIYGAAKRGSNDPYLVHSAYEDGKRVELTGDEDFVSLFSIRRGPAPPRPKPKTFTTLKTPAPGKEQAERDSGLVDLLTREMSDDRATWLKIGASLFSISSCETYLGLWKRFSELSEKNVDGECDRIWESFERDGVRCTRGTLCHYAGRANPVEFSRQSFNAAAQSGWVFNAAPLARIFVDHATVKKTSTGRNPWWTFGKDGWEVCYEINALVHRVLEERLLLMRQLAAKEVYGTEDEVEKARWKLREERCFKALDFIGKGRNQGDILRIAGGMVFDPDFVSRLDCSKERFSFGRYGSWNISEGVMEVQSPELENGRFSIWPPRGEEEPEEFGRIFRRILGEGEVEVLVTVAAAGVRGYGRTFLYLHGPKVGGKTFLCSLLAKYFHTYYTEGEIGIFLDLRKESGKANSTISSLLGSRLCVIPEMDETLRATQVKRLTDGAKRLARGLYQERGVTGQQMTLYVTSSNAPPRFDEFDEALDKRFVAIHCNAHFVPAREVEATKKKLGAAVRVYPAENFSEAEIGRALEHFSKLVLERAKTLEESDRPKTSERTSTILGSLCDDDYEAYKEDKLETCDPRDGVPGRVLADDFRRWRKMEGRDEGRKRVDNETLWQRFSRDKVLGRRRANGERGMLLTADGLPGDNHKFYGWKIHSLI